MQAAPLQIPGVFLIFVVAIADSNSSVLNHVTEAQPEGRFKGLLKAFALCAEGIWHQSIEC